MAILESHHFRLPVCRFVIDLFDKNVLRQIVLEIENDSDEEGAEDDDEDEDSDEKESPILESRALTRPDPE